MYNILVGFQLLNAERICLLQSFTNAFMVLEGNKGRFHWSLSEPESRDKLHVINMIIINQQLTMHPPCHPIKCNWAVKGS